MHSGGGISMAGWISELRRRCERGESVPADLALEVLKAPAGELPDVFASANALRRRFFGDRVRLCSIVNAKSGACPEDCAFCAQSARHRTEVKVYPLLGEEDLKEAARRAAALPIDHFGVVTSGPALSPEGVRQVACAISSFPERSFNWCASLGSVDREALLLLKEAGLRRFHHNLETSERFFSKICSTHSFSDRLRTLRAAKEVGLEVCSGGLFGMGESLEDRVEFALTLAREKVNSIPLNFLIPIPGTPLEGLKPMRPLDILRCVAMVRFCNPQAEIKVCAGRDHLKDLMGMIFYAGATGMMIGPLLTVAGRDVAADLQLLEDLELSCDGEAKTRAEAD